MGHVGPNNGCGLCKNIKKKTSEGSRHIYAGPNYPALARLSAVLFKDLLTWMKL